MFDDLDLLILKRANILDHFFDICHSNLRRKINIMPKAVARNDRINQMISWRLTSYMHAHGLEPRILGEHPPPNHPLLKIDEGDMIKEKIVLILEHFGHACQGLIEL